MSTTHTNEHELGSPIRVRSFHGWIVYLVLAVIVGCSLALHFNHLGHLGIKDLDEAYHAIVARSMLSDPLKPMLYATAYLPYDFHNWQANHIWLHKPPVALWQIAGSFAMFGESNFTLRLPSAILASAAVVLTFLIGRSIATAEAGLVAAALQALAPAITRLVHGQVFSDHVDVAMLFWCEMAVVLLLRAARTGRISDAALVGVVQSIAWMTKSYPALFIAGLVVVLFATSPWLRDGDDVRRLRVSLRQLIAFVVAALLTAAPWVTWCLIHYPREFTAEQFAVFKHLSTDVENFAAPWDRLLADYLQRGFIEWYALVIVATLAVTYDAVRRRDSRRLFIAAWAWIVLVPHVLAASKTPTATLIGWPAGWLAVGIVASDALRGRRFAIGSLVAAALLLIVWPQRPSTSVMGYGEGYHFGKILAEHWPIVASAAIIALGGAVAAKLHVQHFSRAVIAGLLALLFCEPAYQYARVAVRASNDVPSNPIAFPRLARVVRDKSPANAVFLVDVQSRGEVIIAMWWLDRACYPLRPDALQADAAMIRDAGGIPMILSRSERGGSPVVRVDGEASIYPIPAANTAP